MTPLEGSVRPPAETHQLGVWQIGYCNLQYRSGDAPGTVNNTNALGTPPARWRETGDERTAVSSANENHSEPLDSSGPRGVLNRISFYSDGNTISNFERTAIGVRDD